MFQTSSPILTKQAVEVLARGEQVILKIGNTELTMTYPQALDLSCWIREEAAFIKSGTDRAKTLRSVGVIHDADAKLKPLPYVAGTAIHIKQPTQTWKREDVTSSGKLVCVTIGKKTFDLHFENALKIAQWFRVRAKEARNTAGDTRHWSEILSDEE